MTGLARKVIRRLPSGVKSRLRTAVHPAQGYALKRAFGPKTPDLGVLSVVIPAFNVEAYLAQCLDSVISQSYANLEIVIVDDGSTDSTLKIAHDYARSDKRIRIIGAEHGGNGRARNIGIAAARGSHLTFADSDDVVAADAYLTMMQAINSTGSDFVVGSSDRLIGSKRVSTKLSTRLHEAPRMAVSLADFPEILDDVFLWNKVFQRKFWDARVGPIPEGVLYEDQETTARAFIRTSNFSVLTDVVYSWRQRPNGSSITQGKGELQNLQDRMFVASAVSSLVLTEASPAAAQVWYKRLLGSDLTPYFDLVANRDEAFWETLSQGVRTILELFDASEVITEDTKKDMDPHARVFVELARLDARSIAEDVIVDRIDSGKGFEVVQNAGEFVAVPNYWDQLDHTLPELMCTAQSLTFESEIRLRDLQDGRGLVLRGHAFVRGLPSNLDSHIIRCGFTLADGTLHEVAAARIEDLRIDIAANDSFASHATSGFEFVLAVHSALRRAVSARISLEFDGSLWSAEHALQRTKLEKAAGHVRASHHPEVIGFAVDPVTETFAVDIDWGKDAVSDEVFLSTAQVRIEPATVAAVGSTKWRYTFELIHEHWGQRVYSYPSGAYTMRHQPRDSAQARPLAVAIPLVVQSPLDFAVEHSNITAWSTDAQKFAVTIGPPLTLVERSKYGQRQIQLSFRKPRPVSEEQYFVIESFNGENCTDSPRAVADAVRDRRSQAKIFFSIADHSINYPEYGIALIRGTNRWAQYVQTARVLVNNNNFPFYFKKNKGQYYLQTWHGTPIKTIGSDIPRKYSSASYRKTMLRESSNWSALVTQNEYSSNILRKSFQFEGKILELGYPRNDVIVHAKENTRHVTRIQLGIEENEFVVLYAPTWRETKRDLQGKIKFESMLGSAVLPNAPSRLLLRGHHNEYSHGVSNSTTTDIDVSTYPEINDLIMASDCLVSDYSSLIFDYSLTGKPIFIFAPDLEEYSKTRGMYLDLELLPGIVVTKDFDSLRACLTDSVNNSGHRPNETLGLRDSFASSDDGSTAAKIAQIVLDVEP